MAQLGRYRLLRRVGLGGMAEVWKAKVEGPAGFEKVVAIKRILPNLVTDEEFIDMFVEEAKLVARLVHPNIVQVFDFGVTESEEKNSKRSDYYIAMEYVPGENLAEVVHRHPDKRLSQDLALWICKDTAKALAYAHTERGSDGEYMQMVHRDISPHNIMLSFRGQVKVTDFGIAKVASALPRTAAGVWKGKIAYMSPEQATLQPLDQRSDIFALGIVLYELITGSRLFPGKTSEQIYGNIMKFDTPSDEDLANYPVEVRHILQKALKLDREQRYQTATEMEEDILEALGTKRVLVARRAAKQIMADLFRDEQAEEVADEKEDIVTDQIGDGVSDSSQPSLIAKTGASGGDEWMQAATDHDQDDSLRTTIDGQHPVQAEADAARGATKIGGAAAGAETQAMAQPSTAADLNPRSSTTSTPEDPEKSLPKQAIRAQIVDADRPSRVGGVMVSTKMIAVLGGMMAAAIIIGVVLASIIPRLTGGRAPTPTPTLIVAASPTVTATATPATTVRATETPVATKRTPRPTRVRTPQPTPVRTRRPTTPRPTAKPTAVVAAAGTGFITVKARPWAMVWVDGKKIADETPVRRYKLKAGPHTLRVANPDFNYKATRKIQVPSNGTVTIVVNVHGKKITVK